MISGSVGNAGVVITSNGGHSAEQMAELCTNRIISVAHSADPVIRQQAVEFRENIQRVVKHYIEEAVRIDRASRSIKES